VTEKEKWNLLHQATLQVGNPIQVDSLKILTSHGVPINDKDIYGNTPLHYAARNRDTPAMRFLLEAGADIDVTNNDGVTPLHQTLTQGPFNKKATELLLQNGANQYFMLANGTIRDYVNTISHGENIGIRELFEKYEKQA